MLPHNVWSCGDYSNNVTGFKIYNSTAVVTGEKSVNGFHSIKINKNPDATAYIALKHEYQVSDDVEGKTAKLSGYIQNNIDGNIALTLQCFPNGSQKSVNIPQNEEFANAEITDTDIPSGTTYISCMVTYPSSRGSADVFVDNFKLIIE